MTDQVEASRLQLAQSLNAVADSLRNCAHMAENYAAAMMHSSIGTNVVMPATLSAVPQATITGKRKAQVLEDGLGDGKKKRRARAPKDPNAPKRPASSYLMFQNDIRAELKKKHPNVSNAELLTMISKQWAGMSEEQKSVYNQATADAKEKYAVDKAAYDARDPSDPAFTVKAAATATPAKKAAKMTKSPPKSTPAVESSSESTSDEEAKGSDESSEEESDEEVVEQPAQKKAKKLAPPVVKDKKQKKA